MRQKLSILTTAIALLWSAVAFGQNFTGPDHAVQAAERYRQQIAEWWTGKPLPGTWWKPCRMDVRYANHSGGGATSFQFDRGHVFGFTMRIAGPNDRVLVRDVIPHEVDHTVRATLVRRPLPRWLDEGCAQLFESEAAHKRFRRTAYDYRNARHNAWNVLDSGKYPQDGRDLAATYATGFSVVEWLVNRPGGRETMIAFQKDERKPSQKFKDHWGMSIPEARTAWYQWFRSKAQVGFGCGPFQ